MATPYKKIFDLFQDRIARDSKFYIKHDNKEIVKEFAEIRMVKLLNQAVYHMYIYDKKDKSDFEVDFYDKDDETKEFNIVLTDIECQIIADVMFYRYVNEETVVKINALRNIGFKDDELVQFSPANTLKEFNASIDKLKLETNNFIKAYKDRDRKTRKYKSFNYNFQ